jgi:hypothetical protein
LCVFARSLKHLGGKLFLYENAQEKTQSPVYKNKAVIFLRTFPQKNRRINAFFLFSETCGQKWKRIHKIRKKK